MEARYMKVRAGEGVKSSVLQTDSIQKFVKLHLYMCVYLPRLGGCLSLAFEKYHFQLRDHILKNGWANLCIVAVLYPNKEILVLMSAFSVKRYPS